MALRSIRSGGTAMTEASFLQFITDLLKVSGVFDITGTQFQVTAGSGLSVNIAVGRAYLLTPSGGNGYPIINDASITNLAITANSSGNPRISSVVLYQDLAGSPNSDDTNTAHIISVDGTPAGSPSAPSGSTIQSAVGAGNPYIKLADVLVNSGASVPTSITDKRNQVAFRNDVLNQDAWVTPTVNVGGTTTLDLSLGKKFQINMGAGNTTFALLNVPLNCKSIIVRITQDGSGGRTVTWFSGLSWPNAVTPTLSTGASKSDEFGINFLSVTNDTTNTSEGTTILQNL
ncbi:MAG TPA: hypothetical protein VNW29_03790 [Candidatus Sulfotelmatobacter sp.]|jgi:hypothetical protein|nr:hypothetical protein [Candidatus Sulfotelmatobacter sp.]